MPAQPRKSNRTKKPVSWKSLQPPPLLNSSSPQRDKREQPVTNSNNNGKTRKRPANPTSKKIGDEPVAPAAPVATPPIRPGSPTDTSSETDTAATSDPTPHHLEPKDMTLATRSQLPPTPTVPTNPNADHALVVARRVPLSREQLLAELEAEEENIKRRRQELIRFLETTPSCSSESSTPVSSETASSMASNSSSINGSESMAMVPVNTIKQIVSYLRPDTHGSPLPEFRGSVTHWPEFLRKFKSSTAERNLSDDDNIIRLQNAIQGTARTYVQDQLKESCFVGDIIERLGHRYGGEDALDQTATRKAREVRDLDSKLARLPQFTMEAIRIQAITNQSNDSCLAKQVLFTLKDKLPPFMVLSWGAYQREIKKPGNLDEFVRWLKRTRREYEEVGQSRVVDNPRRARLEEMDQRRNELNPRRTRYDDPGMRSRFQPNSKRPPTHRYQPYPKPQREAERPDKRRSTRTPDRVLNIKEREKKEENCEICAADYGHPHGDIECPFKQKQ